MPNRNQFDTHKEYLEWYRKYRNSNRIKLRKYKQKWQKKYRKNIKKALK